MRNTLVILFATIIATFWASSAENRPPNIIFIIADDLGYGDVGCYGQKKIKTPNLDNLAREGIRFTQHYSGSPVCAPSRCVLLTGKHTGHAFIRDNKEVKPEGQYPIPEDTVTIAKLLKKLGYTTGAVGKWGLGSQNSSGSPLKQGFDYFFGYNCQRHAHNYYPIYLWENDKKVTIDNPEIPSYQKFPVDADPTNPKNYEKYSGKVYSPDLIAEKARNFVVQNKNKPFFLYWATTVPHVALQVPQDSLAEYLGKFDDKPYLGDNSYLPHYTPRAAYAAMITRMDNEIGKMVNLIKSLGLEDNTIFVFTSDNGPVLKVGGADPEFFNSTGGLRGYKGSLYEGGIRVPLIVRWKNHIQPNKTSDFVCGFEDWLPTILELCGRSDLIPKDCDGTSFANVLFGKNAPEKPFIYREFPGYGGQQSVRMGDWKLIKTGMLRRNQNQPSTVELFNLKTDPFEKTNLISQHPEIVEKLEKILSREHIPSDVFPFPPIDNKK